MDVRYVSFFWKPERDTFWARPIILGIYPFVPFRGDESSQLAAGRGRGWRTSFADCFSAGARAALENAERSSEKTKNNTVFSGIFFFAGDFTS